MLQETARRPGVTSTGWWVVGASLAALSWLVAGAALVLLAVTQEPPPDLAYWVMDVLSGFVYGAAVLVVLPRTRHSVGWVLAAVGAGCGLSALAGQYAALAALHDLPAGDLVGLHGGWVWMPGTYASMAVLPFLVWPPRSPARPRPAWATALVVVGSVAVALACLRVATASYVGLDNPLAVTWGPWESVFATLGRSPSRAVVLLTVVGAAWLAWSRWRTPGDDARGLGWLVVGELFLAAGFAPLVLVDPATDPVTLERVYEVSGLSLIAAQAFLPVALLVVVLRQRLWGVDLAVSRVTVWSLLTGSVVVGYAALAWLVGRLLPVSSEVAGLAAVGLVVALGQPLRWWIQGRVDRLVYGERADPVALIDALSRGGDAPDGGRLELLTAALCRSLRLGGVQLTSEDQTVRVTAGRLQGEVTRLPLTVDGERLGRLDVTPVEGQRLDEHTRRQLEQLRGVLAVALELALANDRLESGSSRLLEVRMEERRMLRRDLHDGMGPALAGVGLGLAAAQRRLRHDPDGTAALLAELEAELERRTDDVRLLARSLLPAQLDDGDLDQALAVLAERFTSSGLRVSVDCADRGLDTRRQLAVYHVAAEALLNAYRHAQGTRVDIAVRREGRGTVLEVVDDGRGVDPGAPSRGVGTTSMRERAAELGGTLTVSPGPDGRGTAVRLELP